MKSPKTRNAPPAGPLALETYADVMAALLAGGRKTDLPFIQNVQGVEGLFQTMSAVNATKEGASDEEWNPLSQRPHSPLPPTSSDGLGYELRTLKTAVDAFTTLAHEMMHIALWEPFFIGRWRPRSRQSFIEFSLMAEGYCFFFSDVVVSGAVRVLLPDGEYALERRTAENAFFHPARAFAALGIERREEILDVYLEGFRGRKTRLWQPRGGSAYAASLADQVHEFYDDTLLPLSDLHAAIESFQGISEFHRRFCRIPGLPTFSGDAAPDGGDFKAYFVAFYRTGLQTLDSLGEAAIQRLRQRRALQMRAYYALQVRWLLGDGVMVARGLSAAARAKLQAHVASYLSGLERLLKDLAKRADPLPKEALESLDAQYDAQVRARLAAHDAWVGKRWMLVPRRAGGSICVAEPDELEGRDAKIKLLQLSAYLVNELMRRVRVSETIAERAALMEQIKRIAAHGAAGEGADAKAGAALRRLGAELMRPLVRGVWSVPMASFDPAGNRFRELVFSYQ